MFLSVVLLEGSGGIRLLVLRKQLLLIKGCTWTRCAGYWLLHLPESMRYPAVEISSPSTLQRSEGGIGRIPARPRPI